MEESTYKRNLKIHNRLQRGEWAHNIAKEYGLTTRYIYMIDSKIRHNKKFVKKENPFRTKLTEELVYKIRLEFASANGSMNYTEIARKYSVSRVSAFNAICGLTWKESPGPITMPPYLEGRLKFKEGCVC